MRAIPPPERFFEEIGNPPRASHSVQRIWEAVLMPADQWYPPSVHTTVIQHARLDQPETLVEIVGSLMVAWYPLNEAKRIAAFYADCEPDDVRVFDVYYLKQHREDGGGRFQVDEERFRPFTPQGQLDRLPMDKSLPSSWNRR